MHVEVAGLEDALDQWRRHGGGLCVEGETGSGRKHLLRWVATQIAAAGERVVWIRPGDGPWSGVRVALEDLDHPFPAAIDHASRLDAILSILLDENVTVLVEDWEACDPETVRLVHMLPAAGVPVVASGADRPDEFAQSYRVPVFGPEQTAILVRRLLGADNVQDDVVRWIDAQADGRPGQAAAALLAALESGALSRPGRAWTWDDERRPRSIGPSLGGEGLPPLARLLREMVDLLPNGAPFEALVAAAAVGSSRVERAIDALLRLGLASRGGRRVWARGELVGARSDAGLAARAALLQEILASGRSEPIVITVLAVECRDVEAVAGHAATATRSLLGSSAASAEALATSAWEIAPGGALAVARLSALRALGNAERATAFAEKACETLPPACQLEVCAAMGQLEIEDRQQSVRAQEWIERALKIDPDALGVPDVALVQARIAIVGGEAGQAAQIVEALATTQPPTEHRAVERWLRARVLLAEAENRQNDLTNACRLLREVPAFVGAGTPARARLDAALGRLLWLSGRFGLADEVMQRASTRQSGLCLSDRARLLNNLGAARYHLGRRREAIEAWEQASTLFRRLGAPVELARCVVNLVAGYTELGLWAQARDASMQATELTAAIDAPDLETLAMLNAGALEAATDHPRRARRFLEMARSMALDGDLGQERVEAHLRLAEVAVQESADDAESLVDEAIAEAAMAGLTVETAQATALQAVLRARSGASTRSIERLVEQAVEPVAAAGAAGVLAEIRCWLALAMVLIDEQKRASVLLEQSRTYAEETGAAPLLGRVATVEAVAAEHFGVGASDDLTRLVELAVAINEQAELSSLLQRIARAGRELLDGDRAFVLDAEGHVQVSDVPDGDEGSPSTFVVSQVLQTRRDMLAADIGERGDLRDQTSVSLMALRSVYCTPLMHDEEMLGLLYVDSRDARRSEVWRGVELMRGLSALAAVAIRRTREASERAKRAAENARLSEQAAAAEALATANARLESANQQLRLSAMTDALTGLYNRRHLTEVLADLDALHARYGQAYSVILLDVDHFKRVNDTWGHPAGDSVLRWVADTLQDVVREEDRVFRFGGEEFVVVTGPGSDSGAPLLAERLRAALAAAPHTTGDGFIIPTTASFGVCTVEGDEDWQATLRIADEALYEAKGGGRNRVVVADAGRPPVAPARAKKSAHA